MNLVPRFAVTYAPEPPRSFVDRAVDLLLRPERFFTTEIPRYLPKEAFGAKVPAVVDARIALVTWVCGMAGVIDRLDIGMLEQRFGGTAAPAQTLDWPAVWATILLGGMLAGAIAWYVQGWWFRLRARWSGAENPDPMVARVVFMWSSLVVAIPLVVWTAIETIRYGDYAASWNTNDTFPLFLAVIPLWSVVVAYRGATTAFRMNVWPARIWFLILPFLLYGAIYFGTFALYWL